MVGEGRAPLRPLRYRIAAAAHVVGKPQYVIEKDYALSYLLAGIAEVPLLADALVFKGGTCLRKAYFPGYRFSEDLDYTSRTPLSCDGLLDALLDAAHRMRSRLLAYGPFEVMVDYEHHQSPHPRGQCAFRVRVRFPWMRGHECSLKVEVSMQEPLLADPIQRALIHEFPGESLETTVAAYRLEEIAAEKLRAFLQSRQHLLDRGWLKNRPRDLYDLWHLQQQPGLPLDWQEVARLLPDKARAYSLSYRGPEDFLDEQVLAGIRRDWNGQLGDFVTDLPAFEECLSTLRALLSGTFG